jgi:hypothetical protein
VKSVSEPDSVFNSGPSHDSTRQTSSFTLIRP